MDEGFRRRFARRLMPRAAGLPLLLVTWWIVIGGFVAVMMPPPAAPSVLAASYVADGRTARVYLPGAPSLPVPAERAALEAFQRGVRESDEAAIELAFAISEWLPVAHGQQVKITALDGAMIQVELLEGPNLGRRVWLMRRNLAL